MKNVIVIMIVVSGSLLAGCVSQPNVKSAIRVTAFGEGGNCPTHEALKSLKSNEIREKRVIYEFNPGDIIRLWIDVSGAYVTSAQKEPVDVVVKEKMWVLADETGFYASLDGEKFSDLRSFMTGSLNVELGVEESNKSNNLTLRLIANPK